MESFTKTISIKLIILSRTCKRYSVKDFSLQKFFNGLSDKTYNPTLRNLCETCNNTIKLQIKEAYKKTLDDQKLFEWLKGEAEWIIKLNNKRLKYEHNRSESVETITVHEKDLQNGEIEISTFAPKLRYLIALSSNLNRYYWDVLGWDSNLPSQ